MSVGFEKPTPPLKSKKEIADAMSNFVQILGTELGFSKTSK